MSSIILIGQTIQNDNGRCHFDLVLFLDFRWPFNFFGDNSQEKASMSVNELMKMKNKQTIEL